MGYNPSVTFLQHSWRLRHGCGHREGVRVPDRQSRSRTRHSFDAKGRIPTYKSIRFKSQGRIYLQSTWNHQGKGSQQVNIRKPTEYSVLSKLSSLFRKGITHPLLKLCPKVPMKTESPYFKEEFFYLGNSLKEKFAIYCKNIHSHLKPNSHYESWDMLLQYWISNDIRQKLGSISLPKNVMHFE